MSHLPTAHVAHHNLVLLVVQDETTLDEILACNDLRGFVWRRLDPLRALVDPERVSQLRRRLGEHKLSNQFQLLCP